MYNILGMHYSGWHDYWREIQ